MGYKLTFTEVNELFNKLSKDYKIYAPKRFEKEGRYSDTDIIRYAQVNCVEDIVFEEKSTYPPKEVLMPVSQTLYYYTGKDIRECSKNDNKKILIFARPCDINAQKRQDRIYLDNGGFEDQFYKDVREKVKFICIECVEGFDTCFCVTMESNKTDDYCIAVRVLKDGMLLNVKDDVFYKYFEGNKEEEFKLKFIEKDNAPVRLPDIKDTYILEKLIKHPMWEEYNGRCVECGSCTIACSTCTCYTTRDIVYDSEGNIGERKRVEASCHIGGFDEMAGGHRFRVTAGQKMRYKVLHKVHDYKQKFGDNHMCVGCGRCTDRCPQYISMAATINKVSDAVAEIMEEK